MRHLLLLTILLLTSLGTLSASNNPNAIVDASSDAHYRTVQEAIDNAPKNNSPDKPWTILIKPGTYEEILYIQREKRHIKLIGEDANRTTITHHLHANLPGPDGKPIGTFRTATAYIDADHIAFENLTFENSAGPVGQALAIRLDGDCISFQKCRFLGFQDTILTNRGRHYFEDCTITGAVDFIFGAGCAWFEKCKIIVTRNGYITAASTPENQEHGLIFSHCHITATDPEIKTFLGRPWRPFAHTVFLNTKMDDCIRPEGWENWRNPENEKTARYAEFQSSGPGAQPKQRVSWSHQISPADAKKLTPANVFKQDPAWNPQN